MSIAKTIHYLKKLKELFSSNQSVQEESEESLALQNAAANQRRNDVVTAFAGVDLLSFKPEFGPWF